MFDSMEEEEDRIFLNSLGVTSANPEDIERDLLEKVLPEFFTYDTYRVSFCL